MAQDIDAGTISSLLKEIFVSEEELNHWFVKSSGAPSIRDFERYWQFLRKGKAIWHSAEREEQSSHRILQKAMDCSTCQLQTCKNTPFRLQITELTWNWNTRLFQWILSWIFRMILGSRPGKPRIWMDAISVQTALWRCLVPYTNSLREQCLCSAVMSREEQKSHVKRKSRIKIHLSTLRHREESHPNRISRMSKPFIDLMTVSFKVPVRH
jgi:hypothetical protein